MPRRNPLLFLPLLVMVLSCGGGSGSAERWSAKDMAMAEDGEQSMPASTVEIVVQPADRKIIRTGELRFEVGDLDVAREKVLAQVKAAGGYVEGDDRDDRGSSMAMTLRLRIPADKFDSFIAALHGLGELQDQSINAQDVTAQWVDVEARLKTKREVEARYLEIVKQAKTVTEVLEVERELGNVRAEIESMEAQMKALRDQVSMSTLTITCLKPQARSDSFTPHMGVAVKEGWNNLVRVLVGALYIWPFVLVAALVLLWLLRKERSRKRSAKD